MRLNPLQILVFGAGLAAAAPLNVIVTSDMPVPRIGYPAVAAAGKASRLAVITVSSQPPSRVGRLCNKMKTGVTQLMSLAGLGPAIPQDTNAFASFPILTPNGPSRYPNAVPLPPVYEPIKFEVSSDSTAPMRSPTRHHHHHHHQHNMGAHHMRHRCSFFRRIHRALMTLGPWEGRVVAFVLGCGIGVLLRMFWVMTVLTIRSLRGGQDDEHLDSEREYEVAVLLPYDADAEEIFVAPPEYADEKQPLREELKAHESM